MKKRVIITLMVLMAFAACEKKFTPPDDSLMVVNCTFNSNGPVELYLTTSYPASNLNNNVTAISDAQIALYQNGVFQEYLHYVPSDTQNTFGAYFSNLVPQNTFNYSITVSEPKYPTASAVDTIPAAITIISCNLIQFPQTGSGKALVNMVFQDNPPGENFYRLNTWLTGNTFSIDSNHDTIISPFLTALEPYVLNPINDTVRDYSNFLLFTDRGFNGQQKQLQIQCKASALSAHVVNETMLVELHPVSRAHYEYFKTYSVYRTGTGSTNISGYVFNNIVNGYGIFAGENWKENAFVLR
jgi:hypothetical protein